MNKFKYILLLLFLGVMGVAQAQTVSVNSGSAQTNNLNLQMTALKALITAVSNKLNKVEVCNNNLTFYDPANPAADGDGCVVLVTVPAKTVAYFNLASCPTGWVTANGGSGSPDVRGSFIRSLDLGKGYDAGRTLGTFQDDLLESHKHYSFTGYLVHRARRYGAGRFGGGTPDDAAYAYDTTYTGGTETRPKNVALLACMKL